MGFFEGELVPVPSVASVEPVPTSSQHTSVPARAVPSVRSFFGPIRSLRSSASGGSAHLSPAGIHVLQFRRSRGPSVGGEPNHALQRTATGGMSFLRSRALRRRCLSLSLSPLGPFTTMLTLILKLVAVFMGEALSVWLLYRCRAVLHLPWASSDLLIFYLPLVVGFVAFAAVLLRRRAPA